jgi:16S rRNA (guanine966-N2)-methyltransferase
MKIIAGTLGGRRFNAPRGNRTHPMSDKIRGALFNSLGDIVGRTILDAFAGSGALGFEAISRGALHATMIDSDKKAYSIMKENAATLGVNDRVKITNANVSSWSNNNMDQVFSILIIDPPFDRLQPNTLQKLTRHIEKDGLCVVNWPGKQEPLQLERMKLNDQKNYGDAQLLFYRFAS